MEADIDGLYTVFVPTVSVVVATSATASKAAVDTPFGLAAVLKFQLE